MWEIYFFGEVSPGGLHPFLARLAKSNLRAGISPPLLPPGDSTVETVTEGPDVFWLLGRLRVNTIILSSSLTW